MRRFLVVIENGAGLARYDIVCARSKAAAYDLCKLHGYNVLSIEVA